MLSEQVGDDKSLQTSSYENIGFRKFYFYPERFVDESESADCVTN
jgi:hypothetical protein